MQLRCTPLVLTILLLSVMSGPIGIAVNGEQIAQESVWRLSFSTSSASSSTTDVATISALPSSTTSAYPEVFSGLNSNSPGIDNIPIKHITGIGGHNGTQKVTYPNKHGNAECKLFKGCVDNTGGFTQPCLQSLQHSIYQVAGATPNATFRPFDRIACAPGGNGASDYCAFVQYPKWTPKNEKVQGQFDRMFTDLYKDMELDAIPIGAIRAGIDWIVEGGAKLCGNALLPVPNMFGNGGMQGHVYILTVDIDHGLRRKNHDCVGQP